MLDLTAISFEDLAKLVGEKADTTIRWAMGAIECRVEELEEEKEKYDEDQDLRIQRLLQAKQILTWDEDTPLWEPARRVALIGNTIDFCDDMIMDLTDDRQEYRKSLGLDADEVTTDHKDYIFERSLADMVILKQNLLTEPDDPALME